MDGLDQRTVGSHRNHPACGPGTTRRTRSTLERSTQNTQRSTVDITHGCALERLAATIRSLPNGASTLPELGGLWSLRESPHGPGPTPPGGRRPGSARVLCGRDVCSGQKRGRLVGKTKRGKGTKIMGVADGHGLPIALRTESASPAEVKLVSKTLDQRVVDQAPERLIGDKAYDSDGLDKELREEYGTEMIAPHRAGRRRKPTQDGRPLRRFRRRWKVERHSRERH